MKTTMKVILLVLAAGAVLLLAGCDQMLESMFQMDKNTVEILATVSTSVVPSNWTDLDVWFQVKDGIGNVVVETSGKLYMDYYNAYAYNAGAKFEGLSSGTYNITVWLDEDGDGQLSYYDLYSTTFYVPTESGGYSSPMSSVTLPMENVNDPTGRYVYMLTELWQVYP